MNARVNGHDSLQPDLSTPEQRAAWGKEHGLPANFILVATEEMQRIQESVQNALDENRKWRAIGRLTFNDKSPQELFQSINRLQKAYGDLSTTHEALRRRISSQET